LTSGQIADFRAADVQLDALAPRTIVLIDRLMTATRSTT
jgi:hypothetical protein